MRNYRYVHLGHVQVAFKPLTLLGMDLAKKLLCEMVGAIILDHQLWVTSLFHGPIYFNAYLNLTLSLTGRNMGDALNLRIQTKEYNYLLGLEVIAIVHSIYYKAMNAINPRVHQLGPPD